MEDKFEEIAQNPQREAGIENAKELRCTKDRVRRSITHLIKVIEGEKKNGEEAIEIISNSFLELIKYNLQIQMKELS